MAKKSTLQALADAGPREEKPKDLHRSKAWADVFEANIGDDQEGGDNRKNCINNTQNTRFWD